jgi:hypothetical protein
MFAADPAESKERVALVSARAHWVEVSVTDRTLV